MSMIEALSCDIDYLDHGRYLEGNEGDAVKIIFATQGHFSGAVQLDRENNTVDEVKTVTELRKGRQSKCHH